jgi:hypothetical protein
LDGLIEGVSCTVSPIYLVVDVKFRLTPVTATVIVDTVTAQVAVYPPSTVVTVIVVFPAATPDTNPLELTVAYPVASLVHVTF